jgi:hypothetical protein
MQSDSQLPTTEPYSEPDELQPQSKSLFKVILSVTLLGVLLPLGFLAEVFYAYSKPSQTRLQLIRSKYEKCCSQLRTYFKDMALRKADESLVCSDKTWRFLQTCLRSKTSTTSVSSINE